MTHKTKAAWVAGVTFVFTALVTIFRELEPGFAKGIWFVTVFWSWNYFAYAFDKQMLPWVFEELQGHGKGEKTTRAIFFWGFALVHFAFLGVMAFAD